MPFKKILTELVEAAPGVTGAILSDWEGEAVELACRSVDEYALKLLAAHQGIILGRLREINGRLFGSRCCDMVVTSGAGRCIVGTVGADYALLVTLDSDTLVGRTLRRFRATRELLVKEIY